MKKVIIFCLVVLFSSLYINGVTINRASINQTKPTPFEIKPLFIEVFEKGGYIIGYMPNLVEYSSSREARESSQDSEVEIDEEETRRLLRKNGVPVGMILIFDFPKLGSGAARDFSSEIIELLWVSFFECTNIREAKKLFNKKVKEGSMVFINKNIVMEIEKREPYDNADDEKREIDKIVGIFNGVK